MKRFTAVIAVAVVLGTRVSVMAQAGRDQVYILYGEDQRRIAEQLAERVAAERQPVLEGGGGRNFLSQSFCDGVGDFWPDIAISSLQFESRHTNRCRQSGIAFTERPLTDANGTTIGFTYIKDAQVGVVPALDRYIDAIEGFGN